MKSVSSEFQLIQWSLPFSMLELGTELPCEGKVTQIPSVDMGMISTYCVFPFLLKLSGYLWEQVESSTVVKIWKPCWFKLSCTIQVESSTVLLRVKHQINIKIEEVILISLNISDIISWQFVLAQKK